MSLPVEPIGLSANQWKFLSNVERYVAASERAERPLVLESTARQFNTAQDILARLNGSHGEPARRGILLADDVGLGKTTVAALVAWVVASAGEKRGVRILAPNDVMVRRWQEELLAHIQPLQECAPHLDVEARRIKAQRLRRLRAGAIQVVKHSYAASDFNLACDLLIVDEAHRAKGDNTAFSRALKRQKKFARRVLILTATPFSIELEELNRMLTLIGGEEARAPVRAYKEALDELYNGSTARAVEVVAERLAVKAKTAIEALSPFVIRHGIEDLPRERSAFGASADWSMHVPSASDRELELILRMDRALRLVAKRDDRAASKATNDARFHVGWRHFDQKQAELEPLASDSDVCSRVISRHTAKMKQLRREVGTHSKLEAVGAAVSAVVGTGEKVLVFCHHHATAQEVTSHLARRIPEVSERGVPSETEFRDAWRVALPVMDDDHAAHRATFIDWLCTETLRAQAWRWTTPKARQSQGWRLPDGLRTSFARGNEAGETIAAAATRLFKALLDSRSSRAVLEQAAEQLSIIPGATGGRVLGVCEPSEEPSEEELFVHNRQPDTLISIFNSPFGPDVLVVTDKLSEGIDLHRYCRHLVHYELDPSPIRTVQRNGRLRRVNSWGGCHQGADPLRLSRVSRHARSSPGADHEEARRQFFAATRRRARLRRRRDRDSR